MANDKLAQQVRSAGFEKEARMIESVAPEDEARFEAWLDEDDNRERWEAAISSARARLSPEEEE